MRRTMTLAELGARLREAREGRNMAVADVADRLKIPTRILQGIEDGSDNVPRTVYVHHFIKEYALLLGFAQDEVTEWLHGLEGFENISRPVIAENTTYTSVKPSLLPVIVGGVLKIVLVIALASGAYMAYLHFFAARDYEKTTTTGEQAAPAAPMPTWGTSAPAPVPAAPAPVAQSAAPVQQSGEAATETQPEPAPAAESAAPVQATQPAPSTQILQSDAPAVTQGSAVSAAPADPAADAQPVALPEGMHQVEVVADSGDCWMGFEPDGKKQQRTLRKGDTFSMTFRDSLVIRLGNARAVRVSYDGRELDRSTSPRVVTMSFPPAAE